MTIGYFGVKQRRDNLLDAFLPDTPAILLAASAITRGMKLLHCQSAIVHHAAHGQIFGRS